LQGFSGGDRTRHLNVKLCRQSTLYQLGGGKLMLRDLLEQCLNSFATGKQHFPRAAKEFFSSFGNIRNQIFLQF
jgi:hypothetical protein